MYGLGWKLPHSLGLHPTIRLPFICAQVAGLQKYLAEAIPATDCILDGEIISLMTFGTLNRVKKHELDEPRVYLFDLLFVDGESLLDLPLQQVAPPPLLFCLCSCGLPPVGLNSPEVRPLLHGSAQQQSRLRLNLAICVVN